MDVASTISTVLLVIRALSEAAPIVYAGIVDLKAFATTLYSKIKGEDISEADLILLEAQIDALSDELNSPMPPV